MKKEVESLLQAVTVQRPGHFHFIFTRAHREAYQRPRRRDELLIKKS